MIDVLFSSVAEQVLFELSRFRTDSDFNLVVVCTKHKYGIRVVLIDGYMLR